MEPATPELVSILTTDLVGIARGRAVPSDAGNWRVSGSGWVPANIAMDPDNAIATPNPWGSSGDVRLRPDMASEVRVDGIPGRPPLRFVLSDIVDHDGRDWDCCPRAFLRRALADLAASGLSLIASFEHEFTLLGAGAAPPPCFSLVAHRRAEPFLSDLFFALRRAGAEPEMILPEYGADQFEVTLAPAPALAAADRAVALREVTREIAAVAGHAVSFCPKPRPEGSGNGVHIHFSLRDAAGAPVTYDPAGPGRLSATAAAFAAGIVRHLPALCAITAPAPISYLRLVPHHWSAAYACLGERNREAALRICPLTPGSDPARSFNLEYRPADATANPYLALGALVRAGLAGLRDRLPPPPLVNRDPADLPDAEREALGAARLPDSLGRALECLSADAEAVSWFPPDLLATFLGVKRREIDAARELDADGLCRRYRAIY